MSNANVSALSLILSACALSVKADRWCGCEVVTLNTVRDLACDIAGALNHHADACDDGSAPIAIYGCRTVTGSCLLDTPPLFLVMGPHHVYGYCINYNPRGFVPNLSYKTTRLLGLTPLSGPCPGQYLECDEWTFGCVAGTCDDGSDITQESYWGPRKIHPYRLTFAYAWSDGGADGECMGHHGEVEYTWVQDGVCMTAHVRSDGYAFGASPYGTVPTRDLRTLERDKRMGRITPRQYIDRAFAAAWKAIQKNRRDHVEG